MYLKNHDKLSTLILSNKSLYVSNIIDVVLRGNSMLPLLCDKQTLTIDCKLSDKIKVGDIIIFKRTDLLVAHRVVAIRFKNGQRCYIEKGDNQLTYSLLNHHDILGKVIAIDGESKWLSVNRRTYIRNYVFAKFSYLLAKGYNVLRVITKTAFNRDCMPGLRFIRRIYLSSSHKLLLFLVDVRCAKTTDRKGGYNGSN